MQDAPIIVPEMITATLGFAVFLLGAQLNRRVRVLQEFNIPEPVTGGLAVALLVMVIYFVTGREISFELEVRDYLLVLFFAGIGLNARFSDLVAGGKPLTLLLGLTFTAIVAQNVIGVVGAQVFGLPFQAGVMFGSAALIGGHGTAIAWGPDVARVSGLASADTLGITVATLGLVMAALLGGPIGKYLIERGNLTPSRPNEINTVGISDEAPLAAKAIDHLSLMRVLLMLHICIIIGYGLHGLILETGLKLPLFVPCLLTGIALGNLQPRLMPAMPSVTHTPGLALVNEFALGAFLAMSLMSIQLWTVAGAGLSLVVILGAQALFTVAFVIFVLFPVLGAGYRAAVLASGFAGFSLGATPTAIANMTAVTKYYGPSPIAFVILPLVSAFFVDLANAVVIQTIVNF